MDKSVEFQEEIPIKAKLKEIRAPKYAQDEASA